MDKTSVVGDEQEIEGQVAAALSRAQIPVTAVDWIWVPQMESSQLVVVTPLHDTKGPRESYHRILEALSQAGIYQSIPIRVLVVLSPDDPLALELLRQVKSITEGAIHVSKDVNKGRTEYSVIYTPASGGGGAIPSVKAHDDAALRAFLQGKLKIFPHVVNEALGRLEQTGSALIPRVQLTLRQAKKLGLAA